MTTPDAEKMLDRHAEEMAEHFDAVVIIASRPAPSNEKLTAIVRRGRGNWFAQQGMLKAMVESDIHVDLALEIVQRMNDVKKDDDAKE